MNYGGAAIDDKNAGSGKTVTVTGITLSGADSGNYTVAATTSTNAGTISRVELIVSATGQDKVYDGTTAAQVTLAVGNSEFGGVIPGDSVTASYGNAAFSDPNTGTGKTITVTGVTLGGADGGNYYTSTTTITTTANLLPT